MEERKEVKVIMVVYKCPECKAGYLSPTGTVLTSFPPQYPHQCNNCGYSEVLDRFYPHLGYDQYISDNKAVTTSTKNCDTYDRTEIQPDDFNENKIRQ